MTAYEYKVVPAPSRGRKARGVKGPEGRFANALEAVMNEMAGDGWEFQRTETLPSEERSGLTSTTTTYRNIMVFRRLRGNDMSVFQPRVLDTSPAAVAKLPAPHASPVAPVAPMSAPAHQPAPARPVSAVVAGPADDDPFLMGEDPDQDIDNVRPLPVALLARAKAHPPPADDEGDDVAAE